jgi:hypothetical protein
VVARQSAAVATADPSSSWRRQQPRGAGRHIGRLLGFRAPARGKWQAAMNEAMKPWPSHEVSVSQLRGLIESRST